MRISRSAYWIVCIVAFSISSIICADDSASSLVPGTRREAILNDVTLAFRWCPPGDFLMGTPVSERNQFGDQFVPQHGVEISNGFWMQETEISHEQYERVMSENPSFWRYRRNSELQPVDSVTWHEATTFCEQLSRIDPEHDYRLPTEAEWEYACRAGSRESRYGEITEIAWVFMNTDEGEGSTGPREVGTLAPNAWGLHDMLGNVSEWCSDWAGPIASEHQTDPIGPDTGIARVVRGDDCFVCWTFLTGDGFCTACRRNNQRPDVADRTIGFRIVQIPAP